MRVIETIHGENTRKYSCDTILAKDFISSIYSFNADSPLHLKNFFEELSNIPLVEHVYIYKYVIEIKAVDAFSPESYTWDCIQSGVSNAIKRWFSAKVEMTLAPIEKEEKEETFAIPHDFKTHREAWRDALVKAKEADKAKANNCAEHDDNEHYWEHELKAFDKAFDALEALNLPEK